MGELIPFSLSRRKEEALVRFLRVPCDDPKIRNYRADLGEEIHRSPALKAVLGLLAETVPYLAPDGEKASTEELCMLRTLTKALAFSEQWNKIAPLLSALTPDSAPARRCLLFCRNFGESYEFKELKTKGADLLRAFGFEHGLSLSLGKICRPEQPRLMKNNEPTEGVKALTERVLGQFGESLPPEPSADPRPYNDMETALWTAVLRKDARLRGRLEEFCTLWSDGGCGDLLRICREAEEYLALEEIYCLGEAKGHTLCRPEFLLPGYYSQMEGLCYPADGRTGTVDYTSSPLNHIFAVWGPHADDLIRAVGFAHLCASGGGLIFASSARVAPAFRLISKGTDGENTDENTLCICRTLFREASPRQEGEALNVWLQNRKDNPARTVIRIGHQSNLTALEKAGYPFLTPVRAGEDRTLEEWKDRRKGKETEDA